jgi:hypothetical protein
MKGRIQLSRDEARVLDAILTSLSERAKYPLSLKYLLHKWEDFIAKVEKGYDGSIYEYTNDLSLRDVLEEILLKVPQSLHDKLLEGVHPWDDRFYGATRQVSRSLAPGVTKGVPPWWFRIPNKLGQEMESDLRVDGILE